jgi:hypothetical protein
MSANDWVAAYAALVSTIALGWNIYRAISDRGKLYVRCHWREDSKVVRDLPGGGRFTISSEGLVLRWTLTNVGTRPLTIRSVGPVLSEGEGKSLSHSFIRMLAPSEEASFETSLAKTEARKVCALSAWDTGNREYRAPREDIEALKNLRAPLILG